MARFGVKEVADVTFYDLVSKKPVLFLDTLKMSNLENNAETTYASGGKGSPRLVGWDYNRTSTFSIQDALLNPKAIAMQTGTELEEKIETIYKREVLFTEKEVAGGAKLTLEKTPIAGSITIYESTDGYAHDKDVVADADVGTTVDFDIVDNVITVADGLEDNKRVIVYYQYETATKAEVITIKSDKFAGYVRVVGDTLWRNEATGLDELVQIIVPKAKISSQFTLTMQPDGEPSVFDFNLDVFKDSESTDMVKIVKY